MDYNPILMSLTLLRRATPISPLVIPFAILLSSMLVCGVVLYWALKLIRGPSIRPLKTLGKASQFLLGIAMVAVAVAIVGGKNGCASSSNSISEDSTTESPTQEQRSLMTVEGLASQFAQKDYARPREVQINRYKYLLRELDKAYPDDLLDIALMTVKVREALYKQGIEVKLLQLLEDMYTGSQDTGFGGATYREGLALVMLVYQGKL